MRVHTLPAIVFKVLAISIIFMVIFDTTLVVVDTVTVHSRMTTITGIMQNEVARNNCMPDVLGSLFTQQLQEITDKSFIARSYDTNITGDTVIQGKSYPSIREGEARGFDMTTGSLKTEDASYGDLVTMVVGVNMEPTMVYLRDGEDVAGADKSRLGKFSFGYTLKYEYTVPCLRYTK